VKALTFNVPNTRNARPEVALIDLPIPDPGKGEVLVEVHFAALNIFDLVTTKGERNRALARAQKKYPVASGIEMAGIVAKDGSGFKTGDRVVGYTDIFRGPFFHSQFVAIPAGKIVTVPDHIPLEGAASIIGGALTAINALERIASLKSGDKILITGATGSVGTFAVQLAAFLGADVSGVCHSTRTDHLMSVGARHTYAYDRQEMPSADNQYDLVFDAAASMSFAKSVKFLKPKGIYITTMPHEDIPGFFRALFSRRKWGYLMESDTGPARMSRLHALMELKALSPAIDSIHALTQAAAAFGRQHETGKRGKILIDFRENP